MQYLVRLTANARQDLQEITDYIAKNDTSASALYVLEQIEARVAGLSDFPERGPYVGELLEMGNRDYREVVFQPYRIIYRVSEGAVSVHLIADGRRDMRTLLMRRLLSA